MVGSVLGDIYTPPRGIVGIIEERSMVAWVNPPAIPLIILLV